MTKDQMLDRWRRIPNNLSLRPTPVPYKHRGSTYDEDGIRITGTPQFIDSVLSRLRDLLAYESATTRLQVVYQESRDKDTGRCLGSWNAYVQVHERGREAKIMRTMFGQ